MKKILIALLGLFILFDIALAVIFFNPNIKTTKLFSFLPKNCKVVDIKYCKTVVIVGNEKANETTTALFNLPSTSKVYAPADGKLSFQRTIDGVNVPKDQVGIPIHLLEGNDGITYFIVFEPSLKPKVGRVKMGEVIGVSNGKRFRYLRNHTLAILTVKGVKFAKAEFDALFR